MSADQVLFKRQLRLLACMYLGYAGFMTLKTAVVVTGPALLDDPAVALTKAQWGALMGYGTLGGIIGKFLSGWAADRWGGKWTFTMGLLVTTIGIAAFGLSSKYLVFSAIFFSVLLAKSAGWPAMAKLIGNWYQPSQFGRVWGVLSTSSRTGTIVATLGIGSLLYVMGWRQVLWVSSGMAVFLVLLSYFFIHENPPKGTLLDESDELDPRAYAGHPLFGTQLRQALIIFIKSPRVWLICGSMMGLTIFWDFLNFVPLYLKETLSMSNGDAAVATSAFPAGSFVSVLVAGHFFDTLSKKAVARMVGVLLAIGVACLVLLLCLPELNVSPPHAMYLVMVTLGVFGFVVAPAYYLPMSIFSIEFGGPHSGFLIALLDAVGFAASMVFSFVGGAIADQPNGWLRFLLVLLTIGLLTMFLTYTFLIVEAQEAKR